MPKHIKGVGTYYYPGERSKNGIVRFYLDRKQYEFATVETDEKKVRTAWAQYVADIIREGGEAPQRPLTFNDAFTHYKRSGERSRAQIGFIERLLHRIGAKPLDDIKPGFVKAAAIEEYPQGSAGTRNRQVLGTVSAVINCCADDDMCRHIRIKKFTEEKKVKRPATDDDEARLLKAAEGYQLLFLTTIFCQGTRVSETLGLTWEGGIDLSDELITLYVSKAKTEKHLEMHEDVFVLLANIPEAERVGKVFPWANRSSVRKWLDKLCKKAGVEFTPHRARDKWATDRNADGFTRDDIMNAGSWTDTRALDHYVTVSRKHARDVVHRKRKNKGEIKGQKNKAVK